MGKPEASIFFSYQIYMKKRKLKRRIRLVNREDAIGELKNGIYLAESEGTALIILLWEETLMYVPAEVEADGIYRLKCEPPDNICYFLSGRRSRISDLGENGTLFLSTVEPFTMLECLKKHYIDPRENG